ncbi:DNA-3-methyladenine glycosylase 2 family protein [Paenibacillus sp.]|uniref:DNA-3-methyladenine glycosylase family protein n=1 Tax=Paenibacillus sp. TaxID=58172 RepID=UPI00283882C3|nr:DNA-3-methyladenine glycosylase 2 family protein [Paenibacillus sp.]MDR0271487.1 DNA-3-methyladenine glycosylase 2 family protein [Paenibacillus sp.]
MSIIKTKFFEYGDAETNVLKKADPVLGEAITRLGKVDRATMPDLFHALVYAVVGQLISAKTAQSSWERMQIRFGSMDPRTIVKQTPEQIQACGLTMKKAVCIHQIATKIESGELDLDELIYMPDHEVIHRLTSLNGIGKWTAEMLLFHALERPDVMSWGDIAIRRGMMKLYGLDSITKKQFDQYREHYSPYGSVASIYLWEISFE